MRVSDVLARDPRDAEVRELRDAGAVVRPVGDHDVPRLDVAVDDPAAVRVGQRVAQRDAHADDVAVRQRALLQQRAERAAPHQLGDEVHRAVVAAGLVEGDDPGVLQPRGRLRLALGPRARRGVVRRDPLDGDDAVQALVVREPHDAEAAGPEAPQQPVAIEDQPRALAVAVHDPDTGGLGRGVQLLGPVVGGPHRLPSSMRRACRPALAPELQRGAAWVPQVILSMANR